MLLPGQPPGEELAVVPPHRDPDVPGPGQLQDPFRQRGDSRERAGVPAEQVVLGAEPRAGLHAVRIFEPAVGIGDLVAEQILGQVQPPCGRILICGHDRTLTVRPRVPSARSPRRAVPVPSPVPGARPTALACPGCAAPPPSPVPGARPHRPRLSRARRPTALACPGCAAPPPSPVPGARPHRSSPVPGARPHRPRLSRARGPTAPRPPGRAPHRSPPVPGQLSAVGRCVVKRSRVCREIRNGDTGTLLRVYSYVVAAVRFSGHTRNTVLL